MSPLRLTIAACLVACLPFQAGAVTLLDRTFARDVFAPNTVPGIPAGDWLVFSATFGAAEPVTSVTATQMMAPGEPAAVPLQPWPQTAPLAPNSFVGYVPYDAALAATPWQIDAITLFSGASFSAPAIATPRVIPFLEGLTGAYDGGVLSVGWAPIDLAGFSVDRVNVRLVEADTGLEVGSVAVPWQTGLVGLSLGAVPLTPGVPYVVRAALIDLEDVPGFGVVAQNRSYTFSDPIVQPIPEPGSVALLAAGLAALGFGLRRR